MSNIYLHWLMYTIVSPVPTYTFLKPMKPAYIEGAHFFARKQTKSIYVKLLSGLDDNVVFARSAR